MTPSIPPAVEDDTASCRALEVLAVVRGSEAEAADLMHLLELQRAITRLRHAASDADCERDGSRLLAHAARALAKYDPPESATIRNSAEQWVRRSLL